MSRDDKPAQSLIIVAVPIEKSEFWGDGHAWRGCSNGHSYTSSVYKYCPTDGKEIKDHKPLEPTAAFAEYTKETGNSTDELWHFRWNLDVGDPCGLVYLAQHTQDLGNPPEDHLGWGVIAFANVRERYEGHHEPCIVDFSGIEVAVTEVRNSALKLNLKNTAPVIYLSTRKFL